jgi:DNA-binding transcriptional MerR regulator
MTLYSIKDLEHFSGIKAHTIRIWEKRYHLLKPSRTETNIRYYSDQDVRKILNIALLTKNGYKISTIATFDEFRLQTEVLRFNKNLSDPEKNIDQLLFYTVNLDALGFEQLLDKIILEMDFSKTIQQVVFPFFERIGILWQAGSIFVAHEHFVSNLIRNRLISETAKIVPDKTAGTGLFFLRENELHELGLLFLNYLAVKEGFRGIYLGQNLPFDDLANFVNNSKFDFVCTMFTQAIEKAELEQYLANLSLVFNRNKILIAGRQIGIHKPKLPSNMVVVKNSNEFVRKISG